MKEQLKLVVKRIVLPVIGLSVLQPVYRFLHRLSLAGMNIGPVGEIATSGESVLVKKLMKRAPKGAVIVDVGANMGEMAILCSEAAKRAVRILAFEPSPTIYRKLCSNIKACGQHERIEAIPLGLSRENRDSILHVTDSFEGNSSLYARPLDHLAKTAVEQSIQLVTLDGYCEEHGIESIFFLKIDIEGEEFACLQGAQNLVRHARIEYLQFEFGGCNIQSRIFFKDFWDLLSADYRLHRVLQNSLAPITSYHELTEIFSTTNFLAVREGSEIPS